MAQPLGDTDHWNQTVGGESPTPNPSTVDQEQVTTNPREYSTLNA